MTNRTREFFDFAQNEPVSIEDMREQIRTCSRDEREHIEQVAANTLQAVRTASTPGDPPPPPPPQSLSEDETL